MTEPTSARPTWVEPFVRVVTEFADILPLLARNSDGYARLSLDSLRLRQLIQTLPEATMEGNLPEADRILVDEGIARLQGILRSLRVKSLTQTPAEFVAFNEIAFFNRVRALPEAEVRQLARYVITDPLQLSQFELVVGAELLREYGLLAEVGRWVVLLFKLIVVLILILVVISYPPLIPFALAVLKMLADIDSSGSGDGGGGGGGGGGTQAAVQQSQTAQQVAVIRDKNAALKETIQNWKDLRDAAAAAGTTALTGAINDLQQAITDMSTKIKAETAQVDGGTQPIGATWSKDEEWIVCHYYIIGTDKAWTISAYQGDPGVSINWISSQGGSGTLTVGGPPKDAKPGEAVGFHPVGQEGGKIRIFATGPD